MPATDEIVVHVVFAVMLSFISASCVVQFVIGLRDGLLKQRVLRRRRGHTPQLVEGREARWEGKLMMFSGVLGSIVFGFPALTLPIVYGNKSWTRGEALISGVVMSGQAWLFISSIRWLGRALRKKSSGELESRRIPGTAAGFMFIGVSGILASFAIVAALMWIDIKEMG